MVKNELITRSPLRILERSTRGGVGKGNIGIIAARKGVGKTACLVHIATDQLFQGKHVIHVSFANDTSHIVAWYEDIFEEISRRHNLDDAMDIHDEITKNRVIMNFRQDGISNDQIRRSLRSMIQDGHFSADIIVIDGFDFSKITADMFHPFKEFAEELGIEIWFSTTLKRDGQEYDEKGNEIDLSQFLANMKNILMSQIRSRGITNINKFTGLLTVQLTQFCEDYIET